MQVPCFQEFQVVALLSTGVFDCTYIYRLEFLYCFIDQLSEGLVASDVNSTRFSEWWYRQDCACVRILRAAEERCSAKLMITRILGGLIVIDFLSTWKDSKNIKRESWMLNVKRHSNLIELAVQDGWYERIFKNLGLVELHTVQHYRPCLK